MPQQTNSSLNGAQAMLQTLVDANVTVCFTNPGTSEMHFVAALDSQPRMRAVLTLFEGVATGAADGYARMAGRPAATLLHLGCGLGNGLANLHNARKGKVPVVNIVGDHATYHVRYDAQLQSDIETVARNVSSWVRTSPSTAQLGEDVAQAVSAAIGLPGQVATLILPADVSWGEGGIPVAPRAPIASPVADEATIAELANLVRGPGRVALLLGAQALQGPALMAAARISAHTGARLLAEVFPARMERGAGLPQVERLAYFAELACVQLADVEHLILVDAKAPVSFFAYPGKKSSLVPEGCQVHVLASPAQDASASLQGLARALQADAVTPPLQAPTRPAAPRGRLTAEKVCKAVGHHMPAGTILVDEAQTSGVMLPRYTAGAPRHDVLTLTGGAIGQSLPNAVGAAIACPDRKVIALVGDGSAMYTIQALWTMARERLDVVSIVFNNRSYAILNIELQRVGVQQAGNKARAQLDLQNPALDFVQLAQSMGVTATRVQTSEELNAALAKALYTPGPHLIEAIVPNAVSKFKLKLLPHVLGSLENMPLGMAKRLKKLIAP
jgi:acetolactate synthase-1/2/3 large subunit